MLSQAKKPVVWRWLGDMSDPALKGCWGSNDIGEAMNSALAVINAHPEKVDGIKISLLDKDKEIAIEPLHPRYAFERACVNTLEQALDMCDTLNPSGDNAPGVAVNAHHTA